MRYTDSFLRDAKKSLDDGMSMRSFCDLHKCSSTHLPKALTSSGFSIPYTEKMARVNSETNHIALLYESGESVLSLSSRYNVSRATITEVLKKMGVELRDGSKATRLRMSKLSREERAALSQKARSTRIENLGDHARAQIFSHAIGQGERELFNILSVNGFKPQRQVVIDAYAIDIVFGNVAMEIKFRGSSALPVPRANTGDKKIVEAGYSLLYFSFNAINVFSLAAGEIVTLLDFVSRNPPPSGQYWVMRSALKGMSTYDYVNQLPLVPMTPEVLTTIGKKNLCFAGEAMY